MPRRLRLPRRRGLTPGRLALLLIALVALVIARVGWEMRPRVIQTDRVELVRVSDGDTVVVRDSAGRDVRVRLMGVDAPELGTAEAFRSALFVAELLEGARELRLEPDPHRPQDRHGRTLGWLWVTSRDGRQLLLNEEIIRAGHGKLFEGTSRRAKYYDRLVK